MSSFVISKRDYMRVAGLVAGISENVNRYNSCGRTFWIYDFETGGNMEAEGFKKRFLECWRLNVESVCAQYHDDPSDYDTGNDYEEEFRTYRKIGVLFADDREKLEDIIHEINFFARSVNYQVEDEGCATIVNEWFNKILVTLFGLLDTKDDRASWGEFTLENILVSA